MKPETHRALSTLAKRQGRSLNGVVSGILNKAVKNIDDGLRVAPSKPAKANKVETPKQKPQPKPKVKAVAKQKKAGATKPERRPKANAAKP